MDISQENCNKDADSLSKDIPVISDYAKSLEMHVKRRYLQKISLVGVDPASIPSDQFDPEFLPSIEATDLVSYLVLETSYYTKQQFKCHKSLEAYNQMVSGFLSSVQGNIIAGKHVVVRKVRHSQRMNDPLVNIWIITDSEGTILAAHCLGCKAGLGESYSHTASVLFYIEAWIRINEKLACTQVKCSWIIPTYVNEVSYERVKDINFSSSKKLKENLDQKMNSLEDKAAKPAGNYCITSSYKAAPPSAKEIETLLTKFSNCKTKAVALSLIPAYANQFVSQSRAVPVVTDLFNTENHDMNYSELLKLCLNVNLDISDKQIKQVEKDTMSQAKGSGFFRHRAGRIGASVSGVAFHSNLAQPPQSCIKSVCSNLYKLNTKAIKHGWRCMVAENCQQKFDVFLCNRY